MTTAQSLAEEVQTVRQSVGYWTRDDYTFVRITGPDAAEWLHSQTTNDVQGLESGQGNHQAVLDRHVGFGRPQEVRVKRVQGAGPDRAACSAGGLRENQSAEYAALPRLPACRKLGSADEPITSGVPEIEPAHPLRYGDLIDF